MMPRRPHTPDLGGRHPRTLVLASLMALVLGLGAAVELGSAHVDVDVGDGQYVMEIGFRDEPAYLGQPNAVYIHVGEYATGGTEPVDGLASILQVEVTKDGQTPNPPLVPIGDGSYEAVFVPTATGDYTFRITGAIGEATVDESVTSSPSTFNSVEPLANIEFPVAQPDAAAIAADAQRARDEAAQARTLGIAGIAIGALGIVVAVVALTRAGKSAPARPADPARPIEPAGKLIR